MSLQVWLPLNKSGDFKNRGLADVTVTNNGATYDANGKIGGCYSIAATVNWGKNKLCRNISMCAWIKLKTLSSNSNCLSFPQVGDTRFYINSNTGNLNTWWLAVGASAISCGSLSLEWTHITLTIDGNGNAKAYNNGQQINSMTYSTEFNLLNNLTISNSCYISDVRIYDHCLSPKEVKEISQGLVLHYPLNDDFSNLVIDLWTNPSLTASDGSHVLSLSTDGFIPVDPNSLYYLSVLLKNQSASTTCYATIYPYDIDKKYIANQQIRDGFDTTTATLLARPLNPGDTVVYCKDLSNWRTDTTSHYYYIAVFGYKDSTGIVYPDFLYTQDALAFGTQADKTKLNKTNNTITLNSAYTGVARPAGTTVCLATAGASLYYPFSGAKDNYTDWKKHEGVVIPKNAGRIRHAKYWKLGTLYSYHKDWILQERKPVYDDSGYENHGTISGMLTNSTDTPRYDKCTLFNKGSIDVPYAFKSSSISLSLWIYIPHWTQDSLNWNYVYEKGSMTKFLFYRDHNADGSFTFYRSTSEGLKAYNFINSSNAIIGWNHVGIVNDSTGTKGYVNGVLVGSNSLAFVNEITGLYIGYSTDKDIRISDLRIYATALPEAEVKELYDTGAMIHKNGTLECYRFEEEGSQLNICKSGELKVLNIAEKVNQFSSFNTFNNTTITQGSNGEYTLVSPVGDWTYGAGVLPVYNNSNHSLNNYVPWGQTAYIQMEVKVPTQHTIVIDDNNVLGLSSSTAGNDHDLMSARKHSSLSIPANTWTTIWTKIENKRDDNGGLESNMNPDKSPLKIMTYIGLVTKNDTAPVTWYIRNVKIIVGDPLDNTTVGKDYITANQIIEI